MFNPSLAAPSGACRVKKINSVKDGSEQGTLRVDVTVEIPIETEEEARAVNALVPGTHDAFEHSESNDLPGLSVKTPIERLCEITLHAEGGRVLWDGNGGLIKGQATFGKKSRHLRLTFRFSGLRGVDLAGLLDTVNDKIQIEVRWKSDGQMDMFNPAEADGTVEPAVGSLVLALDDVGDDSHEVVGLMNLLDDDNGEQLAGISTHLGNGQVTMVPLDAVVAIIDVDGDPHQFMRDVTAVQQGVTWGDVIVAAGLSTDSPTGTLVLTDEMIDATVKAFEGRA